MARHSFLLSVCVAALVPGLALADPIKRMQQPALSPDGSTIAFSWQGDIWTVPRDGGRAVRLTVHPANDIRPKWSPDGSRIAFASNRFGGYSVFSMRADGSDLKRLTFEPFNTYPSSFSPDGAYIYGSTSAWSRSDLFRIRSVGGPMVRLTSHPYEASYLPTLSPDGKTVYYNRGAYGESSWQKSSIHSSALPDIWLADNTVPLTNHRRLTPNETTFLAPQPAADGSITFICNEDGWPNVWRMRPDGAYSHAITHYTNGTCHDVSVSRDGKLIAYTFESELYVLDMSTGLQKKPAVEVPADARSNSDLQLNLSSGIVDPTVPVDPKQSYLEFSASPDSKRAIIGVRGSLFVIPDKGGTTRRIVKSNSLAYQGDWLDAKTILYTATGPDSRRELRSANLEGVDKPFLTDPNLDLLHPIVSPDGKSVAFQRGDNQICVVPAAGGTPKVVLKGDFRDGLSGPAMVSWSPDSKWLAAGEVNGRRTDVVVVQIETGRLVTVAKLVYRPSTAAVTTPMFLPNGRGVYFISPEFEQPDLFVVDLVPPEPNFAEDDLEKIDVPKVPKAEGHVEVYEPNIEQRMRRLTTHGAYAALATPDSKSVWTNVDGQLVSVNLATGLATPVAGFSGSVSDLWPSPSGSKMIVAQKGKLFAINTKEPGGGPIPFAAEYTVNTRAEELALFHEIWWALDRRYYDPRLNGKDWRAIREKYAQVVPFTFDRADFYALMAEMMEELDSSHLGSKAPGSDIPGVTPDNIGFIGVEFDAKILDARGVYVVSRVLPGSPADNPNSSMLVGDRVLLVDGDEPSADRSVSALLQHKVGKHVVIKVDRDGVQKQVDIKPVAQSELADLEYEAWVRRERAAVDRLSGGEIGYVHIRAMDKPSLDRFLRESRIEGQGKKGLLIDCRFNGGGSTAVDILNTLLKTPWLIRTTRGEDGQKISENLLRGDAVELPCALLVNSASFSNAEVMAEGFRALKRGPIVGERTPGYVIGTGAYTLWDGGTIRLPEIGAYAITGENLENNGRRPDVNAPFDPNLWLTGRDTQLERAVQALQRGGTNPTN